jgi:hypothetical protein
MKVYPSTRAAVHDYQIPADNRFRVKDGTLIRCKNRDIRFPIVWEVNDHPMTHSKHVNKIWVILMDTSDKGRREMSKFESILTTPLGPDALMNDFGKHVSKDFQAVLTAHCLGQIEIEAGTLVFGRSLDGPVDTEGYRTSEDDMLLCCVGDG